MKQKTLRLAGLCLLVLCWATLTVFAWFGGRTDISQSERRPLTQAPSLTAESLMGGKFMTEFEDFTLDQFPLRDTFRTVKSLFHFYGLGQQDNNGIYLSQGAAVKQLKSLNTASLQYATGRFDYVYQGFLKDKAGRVFVTVVPDKGYYLAQSANQLSLSYDALFSAVREGMPWAQYIDLTGSLTAQDYYRTDTHWRQECLLPAAQTICSAMGLTLPQASDFTVTQAERPFYGVYYGQAALPIQPDTLCLMESPLLDHCTVTYYDYTALGPKTGKVYDLSRLEGNDLYETYLAGPRSLIAIENPAGQEGRELVVFRDSFGSSMTPLILADYSKITLIDIRYISMLQAQNYVNFEGADVLFLYSTLILNDSAVIRP